MTLTRKALVSKPLDSVVFFGVVVVVLGIGCKSLFSHLRSNRKKKTTKDFLTNAATHDLTSSALSLFTSTLSGHLLVRLPSFVYYEGPQYWIAILHLLLAVAFVNWIVVPTFMRLHVSTAIEYLEKRFGQKVLVVSFVFQMLDSLLATAFWLKIPLNALSALTGFSRTWTLVVSAIVVILYSSFGGMKSIVRVDMIHLAVIATANLALITKGTVVLGGFKEVFVANTMDGRKYYYSEINPFSGSSTSFAIVAGYLNFGILTYGFSQSVLDKYLPAAEVRKARKILWLQVPLMASFFLISTFLGMAMYAFYYGCDPYLLKRATASHEILPTFVQDLAGTIPGFVGLFSASFLSGALSAVASNLNGVTSIVNEHFVRRSQKLTQVLKMIHLRVGPGVLSGLTSVLFMPLAILIAILDTKFSGMFTSPTTSLNILETPIFGLYLLGFFNRRATTQGAVAGLAAGTCFGILFLLIHFPITSHSPEQPDIPPFASVHLCKEAYCSIVHGKYTNNCTVYPSPQSIPPPKFLIDVPLRLAYGMGGFVSILITVAVGSLWSYFVSNPLSQSELEKNNKFLSEVYLLGKKLFPDKGTKME